MPKRFIPIIPTIPPIVVLPIPWPPWPIFPIPSPSPTFPELTAEAEEEFVGFVENFAKNNRKLIEKRYKEAEGDAMEAGRLVLCDIGLDKDVPKATYIIIITGGMLAWGAISFAAGVVTGVLISK